MTTEQITIRVAGPGDEAFQAHADLHAEVYGREHGFGEAFTRLVSTGLHELSAALADDPQAGRFWVVEIDGGVRGGIGITRNSPARAQLRWFLLHPDVRGNGIGRDLVGRVVDYARERGFGSIFLTTIPQLTTAAHLYREAGFAKIREKPVAPWGGPGITQIYALGL